MLGQHEIKGFAVLINRTVALHPCAFDLDIGLVHAPGAAGCRLSTLGLTAINGEYFTTHLFSVEWSTSTPRSFHHPQAQREPEI